jgi:hypothetical protein
MSIAPFAPAPFTAAGAIVLNRDRWPGCWPDQQISARLLPVVPDDQDQDHQQRKRQRQRVTGHANLLACFPSGEFRTGGGILSVLGKKRVSK